MTKPITVEVLRLMTDGLPDDTPVYVYEDGCDRPVTCSTTCRPARGETRIVLNREDYYS